MNEWVGRWPDRLAEACLADARDERGRSLDEEFEARLRDSAGLAFSIAYGVLRNRADAEEVAQDGFEKAYRRFNQLRDRGRFRAWLTRMTWRLAIDRWRSDTRRARREQAAAPDSIAETTEEVAIARERAAIVWREIDRLPDKLRMVIILAAIEGHDTVEVARLLDIPDGTVKSRLFQARRTLAANLRWLTKDTFR